MSNKNPEEMSMDELRELALQGFDQVSQEKPRDEQGRFVKPEATADDEEVVYQRTIDLGDGSGTQVFEGKTMEELIDKLAAAQTNATRKIREQAQALKTRPEPLPKVEAEKPLTEEEKWLLQQRMQQDPQSVINDYVKREVERQENERKAAEEAARLAAEQAEASTNQWIADTQDYFPSPKNGKRMEKYLQTQGLELTPENLTIAFNDLNESGLLEARPTETNTADTEEPAHEAKRIVEPTANKVTTVRRKVVGGLSTKRSAPIEQAAPGLSEDDLYKMPMDQLERLLYAQNRS